MVICEAVALIHTRWPQPSLPAQSSKCRLTGSPARTRRLLGIARKFPPTSRLLRPPLPHIPFTKRSDFCPHVVLWSVNKLAVDAERVV